MNDANKGLLFEEVLLKNPVLISAIGLCPVVAICASLKAAVIMSIVTIITLVVAQTLASVVFHKIPRWIRASLYMLVGMVVVVPTMLILGKISPETMVAMGIYLPLLSVNPLIVRQCEREGVDAKLSDSVVNALCAGLAYSVVLLIVGLIREIIGNGTIWDFKIPGITPAAAFLMPMGGFVIIAYLAALLRVYFRKLDPEFADEIAINSRATTKRHRGMKEMLIDVDEPEESVYAMPEAEPIIIPVPAVVAEPEKKADLDVSEKPKSNKSTAKKKQAQKSKAPKKAKQPTKANKQKKVVEKEVVVSPVVETPVEQTSSPATEESKPKFEFITLELPSSENKDQQTEKADAEKPKTEKAQKPKKSSKASGTKGQTKKKTEPKTKVKKNTEQKSEEKPEVEPKVEAAIQEEKVSETTKKKNDPKILYKSEELERLMSLSLDDIINELPSQENTTEGGETK